RIEAGVQRAVKVQPPEEIARRRAGRATAERGEGAADKDLSVSLHGQRTHIAVCAGIERHVERAINVEPSDMTARRYAGPDTERSERTANQDLSVCLRRHHVDHAIRVGIEAVNW